MRTKKILLPLVVSVCLFFSGCTAKQIAEVSAKLAIAVQGFQNIEVTLHDGGKISNAEHIAIQQGLLKFSAAGIALDAGLVAGDSKTSLAGKVLAFADSFTNLNAATFNVKDANSQAEFQIAMASMKVLVDSLAGLVK